MIKSVITLLFAFGTIAVFAQAQTNISGHINGEISSKSIVADTIFFTHGPLDDKYYTNGLASSPLKANHYIIDNNLPYPQMYKIYFASDKNILVWRKGLYFVDATTTSIQTNYLADNCSLVNGITAGEYQNRFIPFATKGVPYDCKSEYLSDLFYNNDYKVDSLLLKYVPQNRSSYVALWLLAGRFSSFGQSALRQQTLVEFSAEIKSGRLWKTLDEDFKNSKIKENETFPQIDLKTLDLIATKLVLPKAKYTLIDFWFARCRPCLDTIPALKKLYAGYQHKGFEIVSISVDETVNVPIWQRRVKEHGLTWPQYLEENNFRINELGIKSFPTFILLNSDGKVIWKDFDLDDLDVFLKKNM
ncbi:TlpA family protein disulfide reductase [Mucilaginibacter sp. FT3.2]|uniref:TlpA family protein disulfide reductase n=1 Tax=Mucilaginibacter sp. FT3.2 TaxID=2723090 RepID=UPI0016101CDB|nr:TlpA disulfide reductase family protein [Mucilaginibacter sp. FT3.2]MBB6233887.1 thiol-disulfide isomerase/thioredoxin [Mucilaginibacter sp. FT3.2]